MATRITVRETRTTKVEKTVDACELRALLQVPEKAHVVVRSGHGEEINLDTDPICVEWSDIIEDEWEE